MPSYLFNTLSYDWRDYWPIELPPTGRPFNVQIEALLRSDERAYAQQKNGYNWWMEQGLGKSAVALAEYIRYKRAGYVDALAVVCPPSLRGNWRDQIDLWTPGMSRFVWEGKGKLSKMGNTSAFVMNYEAARNAGGKELAEVINNRRTYMVIDEAHNIKNPNSDNTRAILNLGSTAVVRRGLTGTPWGNNVMDLWPQLRFAAELEGSNPYSFRAKYAQMGGYMGKKVTGINTSNFPQLQTILDRSSFRALKSEWAKDLPPKLPPVTMPILMPIELRKHYESMLQDFAVLFNEDADPDDGVFANMVLTQMTKLQQISSGFIYDDNRKIHTLYPFDKLPKTKALEEIFDGLDYRAKFLVVAHFVPTVRNLIDHFTKVCGGTKPCFIAGGMSPSDMDAHKAAFNSDSGPRVMVIQTTAGKEGHTLLGTPDHPCHTMAFFENNFSLINRSQIEDRPHRWGQTFPVSYYDFTSSHIESKAILAVQEKRSVAHAVIDAWRTESILPNSYL